MVESQISNLERQNITRHGSRSPLKTYPTDPYPFNDTRYWPNGPHQLTEFGKWQSFQTGRELKRRYSGFLKKEYFEEDLLMAYNPFDRDYDSALCTLAGLYPIEKHFKWCRKRGRGDPLVLREFDIAVLYKNSSSCPAFYREALGQYKKLDCQETNRNKKLLKYLSQHTGQNMTRATEITFIYDALIMQFQEGLKLPTWSQKVFPQPLKDLYVKYMSHHSTGTKIMERLGSGPQYRYLTDMMYAKLNGTSRAKKIYVEATHDLTILSLLSTIGQNTSRIDVETGAYLIMELHLTQRIPSIKVFFLKNSHGSWPKRIDIKGCPTPCPLDNFNHFVDSITPTDFERECNQL